MAEYERPQTPQVLLHRLPDKPDVSDLAPKPSKYIILIMGSTNVAGKVQISQSVASALSCSLYQGDTIHESSAKAATVGTSKKTDTLITASRSNEERYKRIWLTKLTRTGLLFPQESRPATEGFSGFGGSSSTSTSRRDSASSVASTFSPASSPGGSKNTLPVTSTFTRSSATWALNPVFTMSIEEKLKKANPALMVLTHPGLDLWHKVAIRTAVSEYGIGVIFVPLFHENEEQDDVSDLPILRPLDPRTMTSFTQSFEALQEKVETDNATHLENGLSIQVDLSADVEGQAEDIIKKVRNVIGVGNLGDV